MCINLLNLIITHSYCTEKCVTCYVIMNRIFVYGVLLIENAFHLYISFYITFGPILKILV